MREELEVAARAALDPARRESLEQERSALEATLDALAEAGGPAGTGSRGPGPATLSPVLERLVSALQHANSDIRYEALGALEDHLGPELLPHIEPLLDDPDEFVQRLAYNYYGRLGK